MDTLPQNIEASFKEYQVMQERQLRSMTAEALPDMGKFTSERTAAFENLKNQLTVTMNMVDTDEDMTLCLASACRDRLAVIMEQDRLLSEEIGRYRDQMNDTLARMNSGKRALRGYAGNGTQTSPRFMSKSG